MKRRQGGVRSSNPVRTLRSSRVATVDQQLFQRSSFAPESQRSEFRLDSREYLRLALKNKWLILSVAFVFVAYGAYQSLQTTPRYQATATLQITRMTARIVNFERQEPYLAYTEFYGNHARLLTGPALAEQVAVALASENDPVLQEPDPKTMLAALLTSFLGSASAAPGDVDEVQARSISSGLVRSGLGVSAVPKSSIVRLSYSGPNPAIAQKIVNAVAEGYIAFNLRRRHQSTIYAREFLLAEIRELKLKLEQSERVLVAYAEANDIVTSGTGEQSLAVDTLVAANDELSAAATAKLRLKLQAQRAERDDFGLPQIRASEAVDTMRQSLVELATEYEDKLGNYKPAYPDMKRLKARIDALDRQIAAEIAMIKLSIAAQYEAAAEHERRLAVHVGQLMEGVNDFRHRTIEYTILKRSVDTNRSLYANLFKQFSEIDVMADVGLNNVSLVDLATRPTTPYGLNIERQLAKSLLIGLVFGAAAAFGREFLNDSIKTPEDIERGLGLPLLGAIPIIPNLAGKGARSDQPPSVNEAYRSLCTKLQFCSEEGVPRALLVTSSRPGEGKSTIALGLARAFTAFGARVLLIDADLRRPSQTATVNLPTKIGLTTYLTGGASPAETFQKTDIDELTVMPSGPVPPNPAELLAGSRMSALLTVVTQQFDVVIIDGPPVVDVSDVLLLANITEGMVLVVECGKIRMRVARVALKRLSASRARMVGAVINMIDPKDLAHECRTA